MPADLPPRPDGQPHPPQTYVGGAHMREDGVIELRLRAETESGIVGEAMFIIEPSDPRHEGLVAHLDMIEPGGYAPVRPIPPDVL
jgi:hypothetical protein